jgi:3-dehydroquinate dehydratase-2
MASLVYVLNGPNLNLLGKREPEVYGSATLADVEKLCRDTAKKHGMTVEFRQSNKEGDLVDFIQEAAKKKAAGIVINPAGYTHSSVALRDALAATAIPFIEVHLSNIYAREPFRHHSYFSDLAVGVVSGLGAHGYELALEYALRHLQNRTPHGSQKTEKAH